MELMKVYSEKLKEEKSRSNWLNLADVVYYIQPGEVAESEDRQFSVSCTDSINGHLSYYFMDKGRRHGKRLEFSKGSIMTAFQKMMLPNPDFYSASYKIRGVRDIGAYAEIH
ncbi:hypothetical protein TCA2_4506 [Paenibacillus sp. TCA20]|uniref:hypothetical protein n=1 Tax=Paenibacillus sp. TCA20 TaxID=1499968 RepID=UPI0004D79BE7|nr:hypothetical protein [Paenibacillus sp. TCA20]GAK42014.1 hypothetical protein TCA2_4506 [Paenibacillus sp. TCA20]